MDEQEKIRFLEEEIEALKTEIKKIKEQTGYSVNLGRIKASALKSGIPFDISPRDLIYVSTCPILGITLENNDLKSDRNSSPSVDRMIPELGYIKGNVRIISSLANRMKNNANRGEIELFCKNIFPYLDGEI